MMTRTELKEILRNGENSNVEFKRDELENHRLAREIVAFLNFEGGMVILGVEDDGSVSGITRDGLEEWVMNTCRDKIRPAVIPHFERINEIAPNKDVAIVRVTRGLNVHAQFHNNKNTYFIRVGSQCREPTTEELGRLFQRRSALRVDLIPVSGSSINDLDMLRLKNYFGKIREQDVPADEDAWQHLLLSTEIMVEENASVAGILLFGKVPNKFLPHAGIDAVCFPGKEKDYSVRERAYLRGSMVPLLDQDDDVLETGVVEQAVQFVARNTPAVAEFKDGVRRIDKPAYPVGVIRETVVNALMHRDYLLTNTDIELSIFEDRVEIISPGRLPNGITPDRMRVGARSARNPLLKDVMRDYGYLEHMGMGIPRKVIKLMKEHNGTDPELIEMGGRFMVRLHIE